MCCTHNESLTIMDQSCVIYFLVEMQSLKSAPAGGACSPQDADFYWGYDDLHLHLQKNLKCRFLKNKAMDYQADCPFENHPQLWGSLC